MKQQKQLVSLKIKYLIVVIKKNKQTKIAIKIIYKRSFSIL